MRSPSSGERGLPSLTMRTAMAALSGTLIWHHDRTLPDTHP
jgi:hypothetical protein